jgi:hypothetical protein
MRRMLLFVAAWCAVWSGTVAAQTPSVTVDEFGVRIGGITPGGSAVVLSTSRGTFRGHLDIRSDARLILDADGDGVIQYTPERPVELRSVWAAVDFTTGAYAVAAPPGFPLYVREWQEASFRKDADGAIVGLARSIPRLVFLLVRPGKGAWLLRAADGGAGDRDGAKNGDLTVAFEDLVAVDGKEKAPKDVKEGDAVIAIDPGQLDVFVTGVRK